MILLDLDPNIVKPGWTPFLITIGLAAVMYLLFRSMRRQFRRVDANYLGDEGANDLGDNQPAAEPVTVPSAGEAESVTGVPTTEAERHPRPPRA